MTELQPGEESTVQLLRRARSGEDAALDELFHRYLPALQRWARGRLPPWARDLLETDDLVQETMMSSLRRLGHVEPRPGGGFQSYLRQAVLNKIRDEIRRVRHRPQPATFPVPPRDLRPSPLEETLGREALDRYETALGRLRPEDREAVLARVELGLGYREVALTLGKPSADAARMAVSRALLRLAREMADAR